MKMMKLALMFVLVAAAGHHLVDGAPTTQANGAPQLKSPSGIIGDLRKLLKKLNLPGKVATLECSVCELVMKEAVAEIAQNKTKTKIVSALEEACTKLPDVDDCVDFMKQYGSDLINTVLLLLSPTGICTFAGACNGSSVAHVNTAGTALHSGSVLNAL